MSKAGFRVEIAAGGRWGDWPHKKSMNIDFSDTYESYVRVFSGAVQGSPLAHGLHIEMLGNVIGGLQGERAR